MQSREFLLNASEITMLLSFLSGIGAIAYVFFKILNDRITKQDTRLADALDKLAESITHMNESLKKVDASIHNLDKRQDRFETVLDFEQKKILENKSENKDEFRHILTEIDRIKVQLDEVKTKCFSRQNLYWAQLNKVANKQGLDIVNPEHIKRE